MAFCKNCNEPLPLLSKVCPVCHYVVDDEGDSVSAEEMIQSLEACLFQVKEIPKPTFLRGMAQLSYIAFPILAIYMLILAVVSQAGFFWLLFLALLIGSCVVVSKKIKGTLGNDKYDKKFESLKNEYELLERTVRRTFGKNKEVATLVSQITGDIIEIDNARNNQNRKNLITWGIIAAIFFLSGGASTISIKNSVDRIIESGEGTKVANLTIDNFESKIPSLRSEDIISFFESNISGFDPFSVNGVAQKVFPIMLNNGYASKAEELFLNNCMGKMNDTLAAQIIVDYYVKKGDSHSATTFVSKCSGLRYSSDKIKLENSIK